MSSDYFQYKIYKRNKEIYINLYGEKKAVIKKLKKMVNKPCVWKYLGSGEKNLWFLQRKNKFIHIHGFDERKFTLNQNLELNEVL